MALTTERLGGGDGPASDDVVVITPKRTGTVPADGLWFAAASLLNRRWLIIGVTVLVAAAAVWISLLIPNRYSAETRVMLPESGGSTMSSIVESVAPGAGALLGGSSGGDYTRYLAILTSRTVMERTVERFDLIERYDTGDKPDPLGSAVAKLYENTNFEVSLEYNFLAVHVIDENPRTAAAIANYFIEELNQENTRLSSDRAREQRIFVETRMRESERALDSVRAQLQTIQERYGISEPEIQAQALIGAVSASTEAVAQAQVQYESLKTLYGEDNEQVAAAQTALQTAQGQLDRLSSGGSEMMPVPLRSLPQVGRQFGQLQQEMLIQAKIVEFVRPMYEQALFDERRDMSAVQIIDTAVPPLRKAEPRRSLIVLGATFSAFVLACAFVVALAAFRRGAPAIASRLRAAA